MFDILNTLFNVVSLPMTDMPIPDDESYVEMREYEDHFITPYLKPRSGQTYLFNMSFPTPESKNMKLSDGSTIAGEIYTIRMRIPNAVTSEIEFYARMTLIDETNTSSIKNITTLLNKRNNSVQGVSDKILQYQFPVARRSNINVCWGDERGKLINFEISTTISENDLKDGIIDFLNDVFLYEWQLKNFASTIDRDCAPPDPEFLVISHN